MQYFTSRPRFTGALLICVSTLAVTVPARSADELDPIIVTTPMRMAQTVDDSLHPVSVITREEIERRQASGVPELIRGLPGVQVGTSGGFGKQASVFLRGTNGNQVIVLIDGVRAGSATAGGAAWEFLPVDQIERIEVVRGPRASAYGADAVGGVIQIFTRSAGREPVREVKLGYGRYNTRSASAALSADSGSWRYHIGASHSASDGYNVRADGDPDDDGYRNDSLNARVGVRLDSGMDVEWRLLRAQGTTEFDNAFGVPGASEEDFVQQATSMRLSGPVGEDMAWRLTLGESRDERDTLDAGLAYRYESRRRSLGAELDWMVQRWQLTVGADYLDDRVDSNADYVRESRDAGAVFAQLHTDRGRHRFGLGVRHDDYSDFGAHSTGDVAWGYRFAGPWSVRASAGTAFRAPTFNDLYFPFGGNPDLSPERSRNLEAGVAYEQGEHAVSLNVFDNQIRDLIVLDEAWTPQNASRARITGWEASWNWSMQDWQLAASYTWLDARDENTDKQLARRARHSARVDVDRMMGAMRYGMSLIGQGRRYDDAANTNEMPGYVTMDLRAAYRINPAWELSGAWNNVLDRDVETVAGYRQPGQALNVELRGRF